MKSLLHKFLLLAVFQSLAMAAFSQSGYNLTLNDTKHREEINFLGEELNLHVCGLKEGQKYQVWAVKFGCSPTLKLAGSGQFSNTQTFVASSDCMDFVMKKDMSSPTCSQGTVWFSIGCMDCEKKPNPLDKVLCSPNGSGTYLIQDIFIGGGCFDVSNVNAIGAGDGRGEFTDGGSTVLMNNGIILTSGQAGLANGPNNSNSAGANVGGPGSDPDLDILTGGSLHDVQGIEFDFRPTISSISFQYVFGSEEYCEFVNSGFNDVFGFFISGPGISGGFSNSGQNIAVLPSSGIFVSINNVNHLTNSGFFVPNQDNCGGTTNMTDIQYDGYTQLLVATANVIPCETYHIRLMVADVGDGIYDSGVFLGAGSFSAGGTATGDANSATTGSNTVYESCNDGTFIFTRANSDNSLPLTLNFTVLPSSTATPGVDYSSFPLTITIPPGLDEIALPINVVNDNIPEGTETIVLSLTNSCSCSSLEIILQIVDPPPVQLDLPDLEGCAGAPLTLEAMPTGGIPNSPFTFNWSNGSTGPILQAAPTQNTTYTVTVTDACGATATAETSVQVAELPTAMMDSPGGVICTSDPNDNVQMEINFTGTPNWILDYTINGAPQPPITVTSTPYTLTTNVPGIYLLTSVTSEIGSCVGPATGVSIIDLVTLTNDVGTTPFTCSEAGTMTVLTTGGLDPYSYTWSNGFPSFQTAIGLTPGLYTVTVTDFNGCTASATGAITSPPPLNVTAIGSQIDCADPSGGTVTLNMSGGTQPYYFIWSNGSTDQNLSGVGTGVYSVTITDNDNCVTTASATITSNVVLPVAVASAPDELDCNSQIVTVFGQGSQTGNGITYSWTGPGLSGPANQIDVNVQEEGLYTLLVTNTINGCTSEAYATVTSDMVPPVAVATGSTLNCNETFTTISGNGSSTGPNIEYNWEGSDILNGEDEIEAVVGEAGTYTFTVTNTTNGCTSQTTAIVDNDADAPTAEIATPAPLTCAVDTVTLDATSSSNGPIYTYQWFQGTTPIAGASGLLLSATSTGQYQIVVTNEVNGCTSSFTTNVVNNIGTVSPTATATGQITCTLNTVPLSSTVPGNPNNYSFQWGSTNGTFSGGTNSQNATATTPGVYVVTVTDLSNGCSGTASVQVTQDASIPVVQVTSSGNIDCTTTQVQLNGNGSSQSPTISYTWTTVDGNIYSGGNTLTPIVDAAGTYTLSLVDASNQCENESSVTVTVDNTTPTINMPTAPMLDCATTDAVLNVNIPNAPTNGGLTYNWTTVDGEINGPANVLSPTILAPGTYNLVVTNPSNNCTSTASITIDEDITAPVISIAPPDLLTCTENTVPLNASGTSTGISFSYDWSSPTGSFATSNTILNPVVNAAGTYTLLVTNTQNNCTATQQVVVDEDVDLPTALAGAPMMLNCIVTELSLNGSGSSSGGDFEYLWTGPGVFANETTLSPSVNLPGTYQLQVTNLLNNCQAVATVNVGQDIATPTAEAGNGDELSCSVTSMDLDGTGSSTGSIYQYEWSSPNGSITAGVNTLNPTINAPGDYILEVTNATNGCTSTDMVQIGQDDSLPDAMTLQAAPITCNVTQITLDGTGSATGPEFTYNWTTSTGSIFSGQSTLNPVVTAPGIYLLTVTNTLTNCSNIASVTVASQTTPPVAQAGPDAQLTCTVPTLNLNGNGSATGSTYSYLWTTVDGNIFNGATTLNPTIDMPGTYTIQVTNNVTGCTNTDQVVVAQSLNAPISVASTPGVLNCNITSLTLSGTGSSSGTPFGYAWTTLDGNIVSGGSTLSPVINEPGTYVLLVTNSTNGCTQTANVTVSQDIAAPTAEAGSANQLSCTTPTVSLNGIGSSSGVGFNYLWTTNNGNIVSGNSTLAPVVNQIGTYVLTVTNTANGCTAVDNVQVSQDNSLPQAAITPPATLTCTVQSLNLLASASQGANFSYLWTTTNGNITAGETTLSPEISQPGTYILTVSNSSNGCTISTQTTVLQDVAIPQANAGVSFVMDCFEALNQLDGSGSTGSGPLAYLWTTTNGVLASGTNTATPSISDPGTYVLLVTNLSNGCTDSDDVIITREGPSTTPMVTQPPCFGDKGAIALTGATGGVTPYLYSIDNGANFSSSAIFTNLNPGLYTAVIQDANGCEFDAQLLIEQPDKFDIFVEPQVTVHLGESYQVNTLVNVPLEEIETVSWFPVFNLSCTDCLNPIATPSTSMTYTVDVVTKNGCKDSAPLFFIVDKTGGVYVPSAFSPNGDGTNDVFMIFTDTKSVAKIKSFLVFNRWGESIYQYFNFEPNNPAYGWDGKHRGQEMDPAVFTWFAEVEFIDGRIELFKGDVTLMD